MNKAMSERGAKRGVGGAPFYAPPRRKTSAEIISEARAAIYGDMNSASNGSSGGVVRPIRTRRPFTPREPQRTLFTERVRKKEIRPPSAFDLEFLSVSESDESLVAAGARVASLDDEFNGVLLTEPQGNTRKKPALRNQSRSVQERPGDGWSGFPKLPHLSGRSKPLHRRNTSHAHGEEANAEADLAETISVTRPFGKGYEYQDGVSENGSKSLSPEANVGGVRKKRFQTTKSVSCDSGNVLTEIPVKHLAVQLPNTSSGKHNSMSLLELSEDLSQRNKDTNCTVRLMEALQKILEKSTPGNNLRDLVLKSLYMHIDSDDERILVAIARAMLTMRVTGTHLAAACKLVFKIARNDKNDHFFRNTDLLDLLVEGCGRADPVSEGECCVYGAGALRFLALEPSLCALALRAGALHLAALHLKILNNAKAENPRLVSEQSTHALYQLTGALRNLAGGGERAARAFVASGALAELLAALQHHTDRDVLTNVARCLSVLSADETCCEWLCEAAASGGARSLLLALAACASRAPLAVRLAYTLGNMAAAHEQARISIYSEDGSIDVLLTILETYTVRNDDTRDPDSDPDLHLIGTDLGGSDGSNEDVLIKTVRVVANLCLAERVGRGIAETHAERTVRALLACLKLAETPLEETVSKNKAEVMRYFERHEELATAALATLNNITFYREPPEPDPLEEPLDKLCIATCAWLRSASNGMRTGAGCEAVRALGNLSRAHTLARRIVLEGVIDHLPAYLEHEDVSVRCAAAGVLVNVCGAGASRESAEATRVCAAALSAAAADRDAHSAALLARALWNAHSHTPLSAAQAHQATAALALFIDDESVFSACEASRGGERRASNPELSNLHVKFNLDNNNYEDENLHKARAKPLFVKAYSVDQELHLGYISDEDLNGTSGEDLGFEEGDLLWESECECGPCRRLAAWEELVGVAIPLLEKLKPATADASVGTD